MELPIENILTLIRENKQIRTEIFKKDDSLIDVVYLFIENPNSADCKVKLENYIKQNSEFINNVIKNSLQPKVQPSLPVSNLSVPMLKVRPPPTSIAGEVYEIEANPNSYKELIAQFTEQHWVYRGLNILEKNNSEGKGVWVLFFY